MNLTLILFLLQHCNVILMNLNSSLVEEVKGELGMTPKFYIVQKQTDAHTTCTILGFDHNYVQTMYHGEAKIPSLLSFFTPSTVLST